MAVDVLTEIVILRPPEAVAAVAGDPLRAPDWYVNIDRAEPKSPLPLGEGSLVTFTARFLGRDLVYSYAIRTWTPERLVMSTEDGPFPMETTYTWEAVPEGTRMTLRNRGEPSGFSGVFAPVMARMMRRANEADLKALKALVEANG